MNVSPHISQMYRAATPSFRRLTAAAFVAAVVRDRYSIGGAVGDSEAPASSDSNDECEYERGLDEERQASAGAGE